MNNYYESTFHIHLMNSSIKYITTTWLLLLVLYLLKSHMNISPGAATPRGRKSLSDEALKLVEHYVSVKKLLFNSLIRWRWFLKLFTVTAEIVCSSSKFHRLTTLSEKKNFLRSVRQCCFFNFNEWPLVLLFSERSNNSSTHTLVNPLNILNSSIISARLRRSSNDHKWSISNLDA